MTVAIGFRLGRGKARRNLDGVALWFVGQHRVLHLGACANFVGRDFDVGWWKVYFFFQLKEVMLFQINGL